MKTILFTLLATSFSWGQITLLTTQQVSVLGYAVAGTATSTAILGNLRYSSSSQTIFSYSQDPNQPRGIIIKAISGGTATLTETAQATEPDGVTKETVTGTITVTVTTPAPPIATAIAFTVGTPSPQP